jgi:hypothetical protein
VLVEVLGLGVLQHLLLLAAAADHVQRALRRRHRLRDHGLHGVSAAAEFPDPALECFGVGFGLPQMVFQALFVDRLGRHRDMGLQGRLQLPLLAVGLVHVLDELCVALVRVTHGCRLPSIVTRSRYPQRKRRNGRGLT